MEEKTSKRTSSLPVVHKNVIKNKKIYKKVKRIEMIRSFNEIVPIDNRLVLGIARYQLVHLVDIQTRCKEKTRCSNSNIRVVVKMNCSCCYLLAKFRLGYHRWYLHATEPLI